MSAQTGTRSAATALTVGLSSGDDSRSGTSNAEQGTARDQSLPFFRFGFS
jgi:hypothetical protein